jgi:hypothetical protein
MTDLIEEEIIQATPFPGCDEIYNAIIDDSPSITAKCYLGTSVSSYGDDGADHESDEFDDDDETPKGKFCGASICDPFADMPYNMIVTSVEEHGTLAFTEDELGQFPERELDPSGPGMIAQLALSGGGHPGMDTVSGYIKFVRVWMKEGENGEVLELFEAYLDIEAVFEYKLALKKHCRTDNHGVAFWAVRPRKD